MYKVLNASTAVNPASTIVEAESVVRKPKLMLAFNELCGEPKAKLGVSVRVSNSGFRFLKMTLKA